MSKRTLTSGERIQNARDISSVAYHNELSKVVREAFKSLPDAEVRRLVNLCALLEEVVLLKFHLVRISKKNMSTISIMS